MKTLNDHLANYAAYHRDRRNIAIHSVGIPLIVLSVAVLLSRPRIENDWMSLSPATAVFGLATLFYLRLDVRFGLGMSVVNIVSMVFGTWAAAQPTSTWLGLGLGLFSVGWVLQFIGHFWEGKKPAFLDDVMGLLIGPLFVAAEFAFALGWRGKIQDHIVQTAGPTRLGPSESQALR